MYVLGMNTERQRISIHEVRIFNSLSETEWQTANQIAGKASVSDRSARMHLNRFKELNLVDRADVFPGVRYKLAPLAENRNVGYLTRLRMAKEALQF